MNEMTLSGLLRAYDSHYTKHDARYLIVEMQAPGLPSAEIQINPKENFDGIIAYYREILNEDLSLKVDPSVKMLYYNFVMALVEYFSPDLRN